MNLSTIPSDPLPAHNMSSSPLQRISRPSSGVLELRPNFLKMAFVFFGLAIAASSGAALLGFSLEIVVWTGVIFLFGTAGTLAGHFIATRYGTKVRIDRLHGTVEVRTMNLHSVPPEQRRENIERMNLDNAPARPSLSAVLAAMQPVTAKSQVKDIAAVQLCQVRYESAPRAMSGFQLNLVLRGGLADRVTLINAGGKGAMRKLARELARFLDVQLVDHTDAR